MARKRVTDEDAQYERSPSYLSAKKLLTPKEYKEYQESRKTVSTLNLKRRMGELKSEGKFRTAQQEYGKTRGGKIGSFLSRAAYATSQRGGITRGLYKRQGQLPPTNVQNRFKTIQGISSGNRGRPKGTLDKRYAQYGGVYGFRKFQATQLKIARMEALRRAAVNPRQQQILRNIEARDNYQRQSGESNVIPSTNGGVDMAGLMDEINRAANAVG